MAFGEVALGLDVTVGSLADLLSADEEGASWLKNDFRRLNEYLESIGLAPHNEPENCDVFSCQMWSYSGLHYLRRIAAHLDLRSQLPEPGDDDASKDEVLEEYYELYNQREPRYLLRLLGKSKRGLHFNHLIIHSDAEGYYLPQDFSNVLFPPDESQIPGGMVGSSVRLLDECKRLAQALQLPLDLDPEAHEVWQAADSQGEGSVHWKRYGIESYSCLRLYHAAQHSLKHGAAIVFH